MCIMAELSCTSIRMPFIHRRIVCGKWVVNSKATSSCYLLSIVINLGKCVSPHIYPNGIYIYNILHLYNNNRTVLYIFVCFILFTIVLHNDKNEWIVVSTFCSRAIHISINYRWAHKTTITTNTLSIHKWNGVSISVDCHMMERMLLANCPILQNV